jgi:hypothetical protein
MLSPVYAASVMEEASFMLHLETAGIAPVVYVDKVGPAGELAPLRFRSHDGLQ